MRRGRPRDPYRSAVVALLANNAALRKQIEANDALIAGLEARAGVDNRNSSAEKSSVPPKQKLRKAKRRRRKGRSIAARKRTPAAPVPVAVPARAPRGAALYATQLAELENLKVTIDADGDGIRTLSARGNAILVELDGRAKLPGWLTKAVRMRWRRCADKVAAVSTLKPKPKRKPTPPPPAVRKVDSGWTEDTATGIRSREIVAVEDRQ